ncbi:MAG: YggS family pyridoxal phosphate-dependent enzyme [Bacteroidales bacterium]|jgi:pyridoxal phosphate enzyme (YggS family)|nr:YggS family pyridoxal phosphate-dependent enzyme [Bacteroidales bacterium]
MSIQNTIQAIQSTLPPTAQLIAVSKTFPESDIEQAYTTGIRDFAENKVQELTRKYENLPKDIRWHFIGHLQTNKIKYIASFVHLIHGVDSLKLLAAINKEAAKNERIIPCLLQFHIAQEDTKFGLSLPEAEELLQSKEYNNLHNIEIHGVMGMASYTNDETQVSGEFQELFDIFTSLQQKFFADKAYFKELSMGMSHDYRIALQHGATLLRIGSTIFGNR